MWEAFRTAAARMHSHADFGLTQQRVLSRRKTHIACEDELAAGAPDTASDLRDADDRGCGETDERIHQDRETGAPDGCHDGPELSCQIKVGKVEDGIRALEHHNAQAWARVHSSKQILEAFEYGGVHNIEGRVIEQNPPVRRCFLNDPHRHCRFTFTHGFESSDLK